MDNFYTNILRLHFGVEIITVKDESWSRVLRETGKPIYDHLNALTEKPYQAPAAAEISPNGHFRNWNSFGPGVWEGLLQAFCSSTRQPLKSPFKIGDWVYGTDGQTVVRLRSSLLPGIVEREDAPGVDKIFLTDARHEAWQFLSVFDPLPKTTTRECEQCKGHGFNTLKMGNTLAPGDPCYSCEGAGNHPYSPPVVLPGALDPGKGISATALQRLSGLPDISWNESASSGFLLGRFAAGAGEAMVSLRTIPKDD